MRRDENKATSGPKKLVVHEIVQDHPIPARRVLAPLRSITVHPTFEGILENGYLDFEAFKRLARDLHPGAGKLHIQVMSL